MTIYVPKSHQTPTKDSLAKFGKKAPLIAFGLFVVAGVVYLAAIGIPNQNADQGGARWIHPEPSAVQAPVAPAAPAPVIVSAPRAPRIAVRETSIKPAFWSSWCLSIHHWNVICTTNKIYGGLHEK